MKQDQSLNGSDGAFLSTLSPSIVGRHVEFLGEVGSTNTIARERASKGCTEGLIIVASSQTGGKGRLSRSFISPEGGLYLSVVLRPKVSPSQASILPLMAGLAVSKAISTTVLKETSLKWPNDVLIGDKKVCGILMESSVKGHKLEYVIIGIGINVNSTIDQFPEDIRERTGTLKQIVGKLVDIEDLLRNLICFLDMQYSIFLDDQIETILDKWSERSSTIGRLISVHTGQGVFKGKALGLDQSGALLLSVDGSLQRIDMGDVEHLQ
jgi:BirA family biotin operon repressor/biotin-[acetyl-CoA-carboxylase] ligase